MALNSAGPRETSEPVIAVPMRAVPMRAVTERGRVPGYPGSNQEQVCSEVGRLS